MEYLVYVGFTDGARNHKQKLSFTALVIYSSEGLLVSSGGICLGPSTNNVAEYIVVIELLCDAISHGIHSIKVHLAS
jgi:ribonuclease HI